MHKINGDKTQVLTDTVKAIAVGTGMLSVTLQEGTWQGHLFLGVVLPLTAPCKTKAEGYFHFSS